MEPESTLKWVQEIEDLVVDYSGLEDAECSQLPRAGWGVRKAVSYPGWQKVLSISHGLPRPDPIPLKSPGDSSKGQGLVCRVQCQWTGPSSR